MELRICKNSASLGASAADYIIGLLQDTLDAKGHARILMSTGASQFDTIDALIKKNFDWSRVEMFHLDEYVGISETHVASFRKYLKEKFISKVNLKAAYLIDGTPECIPTISAKLLEEPIDVGLIGIGENAHIAFNDPPADFDTDEAYIVVNLNETCKRQQVREGWFATVDDVPKQAISMSCRQIMQCHHIVSCVPHSVKADAIHDTFTKTLTNTTPATLLKSHPSAVVYTDLNSAAKLICGEIVM